MNTTNREMIDGSDRSAAQRRDAIDSAPPEMSRSWVDIWDDFHEIVLVRNFMDINMDCTHGIGIFKNCINKWQSLKQNLCSGVTG